MVERDSLIGSYVHLKKFPRPDEALHTLKKIASMVKPIMRARGWRVGTLTEFYPGETNLLGLNVDRGSKICLRLRYPADRDQFLPWDKVLDTMLHELCHNVIGPHNEEFHKLWDNLREEAEGLLMKGFTGEGFLGEGRRLGGSKRIPPQEARRLARQAAAERQQTGAGLAGPGHRLGGKAARPAQDIRKVIADAAQRRNETTRGCASENMNDKQIRDLADSATRNGFRTKAEEDEANEIAIAQAMWELVQEDEKAKYGSDYVQPTPQNPTGLSARSFAPSSSSSKANNPGPSSGAAASASGDIWVCNVCTLHNPRDFLACDACGSERSGEQVQKMLRRAEENRPQATKGSTSTNAKEPEVVDLTTSPPRKRDEKRRRFAEPVEVPSVLEPPPYWRCRDCGMRMERKWWTCSACGRMKESSR